MKLYYALVSVILLKGTYGSLRKTESTLKIVTDGIEEEVGLYGYAEEGAKAFEFEHNITPDTVIEFDKDSRSELCLGYEDGTEVCHSDEKSHQTHHIWKVGMERSGRAIATLIKNQVNGEESTSKLNHFKVYETMDAGLYNGCFVRKNLKTKLLNMNKDEICQNACEQDGYDRFSLLKNKVSEKAECHCIDVKQNKRLNVSPFQFHSKDCSCMHQSTDSASVCVYHTQEQDSGPKPKALSKTVPVVSENKYKVKSVKQSDELEYDLEKDLVSYDCTVPGQAIATNIETLVSANFGAMEGYEGSDVEGTQCISDSSCCPGYHCCRLGRCENPEDMFQCEPVKPDGSFCTQGGECDSGICSNRVCEPVKPDGSFCTQGGECDSGICSNNVCGTESSDEQIIEAQCTSFGQTLWSEALSDAFPGVIDCFENEHCCNDAHCTEYSCEDEQESRLKSLKYEKAHKLKSMKQETDFECSDPDQAVKTNLEAISGLDFGGLTDEPQCLSDESCCPGYFCCNNGIQPCEDDSEIFKCERTKEIGATCAYGGACESGICVNEECRATLTDDIPDLTDLDLESCESTGKTVEGALLSSLGLIECGDNSHCCEGEQCCRSVDCLNGGLGFRCEPFKEIGSECRHDSACASGRCVEGFSAFGHSTGYSCMAPAVGLGGACHGGSDCETGLGCSASDQTCQNTCTENMDPEGSCAAGQRCGSGWNSLSGVCEAAKELDSRCIFDFDCASGSCRGSNIPPSTPTCRDPVLLSYGSDCNDKYDCESDICSPATGKCSNDCTSDSDCTDGLFCIAGWPHQIAHVYCRPKLELGERCNQPQDCESDVCAPDNDSGLKYCASTRAPTRPPTPSPTPAGITVAHTRPSTYTSAGINIGRFNSPEACAEVAIDDDRCDGYEIMIRTGTSRRTCYCIEMPSTCPTTRSYRSHSSYDIYEYDNKECVVPSIPEGLTVIANREISYGNYRALGTHNLAHCISAASNNGACTGNTVHWRANGESCYCMTVPCNTSGALRSSYLGNSLYQYEFCPTSAPTMPPTSTPTRPPTRPPTNAPGQQEPEDTNDGFEVITRRGKMSSMHSKRLSNTANADLCIAAARNDSDCNHEISYSSTRRECHCKDISTCPASYVLTYWIYGTQYTTIQYEACS